MALYENAGVVDVFDVLDHEDMVQGVLEKKKGNPYYHETSL